jgi:endonuclease/exonuclease/phosphatase family metal-dependent hydrolase
MLGDFNAIPDNDCVAWILSEQGGNFKSSYKEFHGTEPEKTYNTGLISPYMDPDPPCTVDYIFYREGQGQQVELTYAKLMGDSPDPKDPTIYGSDHFPLIADFEIKLRK